MTRRPPRRGPFLLGAAALLLASCRVEPPLERANPYDPGSIYDLAIDGPDSTHAMLAQAQFTLTADPALPPGAYDLDWTIYGDQSSQLGNPIVSDEVFIDGEGRAEVRVATARYRRQTAVVALDRVDIGKSFWIGQKAVEMDLSCAPPAMPADPCTAARPMGSEYRIYPRMRDPNGVLVTEERFALARGTTVSRNAAVATWAQVPQDSTPYMRVLAIAPGTAWVVVRIDDAVDSVHVSVSPP
jgi:hypothetical protein